MKTLSKIKLSQFSNDELERRNMNLLKGGCGCTSCTSSCTGQATMRPYDDASSMSKTYQY